MWKDGEMNRGREGREGKMIRREDERKKMEVREARKGGRDSGRENKWRNGGKNGGTGGKGGGTGRK